MHKKNFANRLHLVLHAYKILFSGSVPATKIAQPNKALVAWLVVLRVTVQPGPLPLTAKPDSVRDRLPSDRDYKSKTSAVGWESDGS